MGQARDIADQLTAAVMDLKDLTAVAACYSDYAVAITPDRGQITGRDGIVEYLGLFIEAFPDAQYEYLDKHESGNVAIDEGYFVGTNTGPLQTPGGESIPATGKQVRVRDRCGCRGRSDPGAPLLLGPNGISQPTRLTSGGSVRVVLTPEFLDQGDPEELLAFYDYPAEHWQHLRTTDEPFSCSPAAQPRVARPEPESGWSARSAARTKRSSRSARVSRVLGTHRR